MNMKLRPENPKNNSVLFCHEYCNSVYEYERNEMVVVANQRIFILNDWRVTRVVPENLEHGESWQNMGFISLFPNFDKENFPFMIISGMFSVVLLNIRTGYFTPLIISKASLKYSQ